MSEKQAVNGVIFDVWSQSFRVAAPFVGPVIWVGDPNKVQAAMSSVADTVKMARCYQHEADVAALKTLCLPNIG